MNNTIVTTLSSGPEIEVKRLKGYHQEWLTQGRAEQKNKKGLQPKTLVDVMADVIIRIGDDTAITKDKVNNMLMSDFHWALLVCRYFSVDRDFANKLAALEAWNKLTEAEKLEAKDISLEEYNDMSDEDKKKALSFVSNYKPHIFKFRYPYKDGNEEKHKDYELELELWDFEKPTLPFHVLDYADVKEHIDVRIKLPMVEKDLIWSRLTIGKQIAKEGSIKAENYHVNTPIAFRNPRILELNDKKNEVPITVKTGDLELLDIEELRASIFNLDPQIDTTIKIEHPVTEKEEQISLTSAVSFFFPSGVM